MTHLFVDTDIILDVITGRLPFSKEASSLFKLIEEEEMKGYTTSLSFSNLYYVLRKYASHDKVISKLKELSAPDSKTLKMLFSTLQRRKIL